MTGLSTVAAPLNLKKETPMISAMTAHRQLRCILWIVEAAIILICLITAVQISTEHGSIWACGPVAIIAVMEMMRIPLSGWAAHLRPVARIGAFIVMGAIALMTFEGMAMAVERFMDQRVLDVVDAREAFDTAKDAEAHHDADYARLKAELDAARAAKADLDGKRPAAVAAPPTAQCGGGVDRRGRRLPVYPCHSKPDEEAVDANARALNAYNDDVRKASDSVAKAEAALNALPKPDGAVVTNAQKALEHAAAGSTMYRVAASWFGVSVKDLTEEQFEKFKRLAVIVVAGSAATATMVVSFVSHATPIDPKSPSKLIRSLRAWIARRRKAVVKTVVVEKPSGIKTVEVPKIVEVERVVTKHIHVPVDVNTWRVVKPDGSLGDAVSPLHVVQGGKQ